MKHKTKIGWVFLVAFMATLFAFKESLPGFSCALISFMQHTEKIMKSRIIGVFQMAG